MSANTRFHRGALRALFLQMPEKLLRAGLFLAVAMVGAVSTAGAADFKTGYMAYQRGDFAAAAQEWLVLAKAGHTKAQYNLGILFDQGKGVAQDRETAVKWWRQSAESGFRLAQHNLANAYIAGDGVAQSYKDAVLWLERASEAGLNRSRYTLGKMYHYGLGVAADAKRAAALYQAAAETGQSAGSILEAVGELTSQSTALKGAVETFLGQVRAG